MSAHVSKRHTTCWYFEACSEHEGAWKRSALFADVTQEDGRVNSCHFKILTHGGLVG